MELNDLDLKVYLKELEISERVQELSEEIEEKFAGLNPVFVSVLSGAFMFTSDLVKNFSMSHELTFAKVKSYEGQYPGPELNFQLGVDGNIKGRDVLIIEDIIDSGRTVDFVLNEVKNKNPKSVSIVSLLWKPNKYTFSRRIDFVGFSIPDMFVVGYGMDYNEYGRNLKDIYIFNNKKS